MPKVLNIRHITPEQQKNAVYVGRPSKWGNPFMVGRDGTRKQVIDKYRRFVLEHLHTSDLFVADLEELRGKDLICWCAPDACHGDVLLEVANA